MEAIEKGWRIPLPVDFDRVQLFWGRLNLLVLETYLRLYSYRSLDTDCIIKIDQRFNLKTSLILLLSKLRQMLYLYIFIEVYNSMYVIGIGNHLAKEETNACNNKVFFPLLSSTT